MKPPARPQRPKPQKSAKPPHGNPRLTQQTRKVLGKHYANKYGVK
jgi:hypothetical protein